MGKVFRLRAAGHFRKFYSRQSSTYPWSLIYAVMGSYLVEAWDAKEAFLGWGSEASAFP